MALDVLLTFQQFKTTVEDPSMYLIDEDMAVLFEKVSLPLPAFLVPLRKLQSWPTSISVWNNSTYSYLGGHELQCKSRYDSSQIYNYAVSYTYTFLERNLLIT